jgi:8-oxo-dGTP pyrophosphatase MutT (NUDIX family)
VLYPPDPAAVAQAVHAWPRRDLPPFPHAPGTHDTGVLVPLRWEQELVCIATLRADGIAHGGQVCFPGGRPSAEDGDLFSTAKREATEELGVTGVQPLGRLSSVPVFGSSYRIHPFVARIDASNLVAEPGEVAEVLPFSVLGTLRLHHIDAIGWTSPTGEAFLSPVFSLHSHVMFGATAHALLELLDAMAPLFGLKRPPMKPGRYTWEALLSRPRIAE